MRVPLAYHEPVLVEAVAAALITDSEGIYVDCTFGGGGHSAALLQRLGSQARLFALDRDPEAPFAQLQDPRFVPVRGNFADLAELLASHGVRQVAGILADLGVSGHQLDTPERGFSYRFPALLDLRMDPTQGEPAAQWLGKLSEAHLAEILRTYGDLPKSRALAAQIRRRWHPTFSTTDLAECARAVYGFAAPRYLAQLFQALRIALNGELEALEALLAQAQALLPKGGRLVVLTYHSGEARRIKKLYQSPTSEDPLTGQRTYAWKLLRKIRPSAEEIQRNPRSRSATLWVCERN